MSDDLDSRTRRLREWYRSLKEPQYVEKASRSERWKREAWMVGSTVGSLTVAALAWWALFKAMSPMGQTLSVVSLAVFVIAGFAIDALYVFPWGFERFDLVAPWQFRDEQATTSKEGHTND